MTNFGADTPFILLAKITVKEDKISEYLEYKHRCINAHPALPPHVVPFVEVAGSEDTSEEIINKALKIYKK